LYSATFAKLDVVAWRQRWAMT